MKLDCAKQWLHNRILKSVMRVNTGLNLKNEGGQKLVVLQQEKRGLGEEEYHLVRAVCVL